MNKKNSSTFCRLNIGTVVDWQTYIKKKKRWYSPICDYGLDLLILLFVSSVFICGTICVIAATKERLF